MNEEHEEEDSRTEDRESETVNLTNVHKTANCVYVKRVRVFVLLDDLSPKRKRIVIETDMITI